MNILVCISRTPETTARIDFVENNSKFNTQGVQYIMNPYDEWYALVRALELVEAESGEVHVMTVDEAAGDTILRKALAIGAHKAFRIDHAAKDAKDVASSIATWMSDAKYDLIFCGKETIDYNNGEVGGMLAAYLDLPYIALVNKLERENDHFLCHREIEGGVEILSVNTPFVLSVTKGIAEQRIPNMRGIMMSKRKPLEVISQDSKNTHVQYIQFEKPEGRSAVKMIDPDNIEELIRLLHEEEKVI